MRRHVDPAFAAASRRDRIVGVRARWFALICAALAVVLALGVLVVCQHRGRLHAVPVAVVAAPIMVQGLAADLGPQVILTQTSDLDAARTALDDGTVRAVLIVDLSTRKDTLVLPAQPKGLASAALVAHVRSTEAGRGRDVTVRTRQMPGATPQSRALASGAALLGFLLASLLTVGWNAPARRLHHRVRGASLLLVVALGAVVVHQFGVTVAVWLAVAFGLGLVSTLALEAVFGGVGFLVAGAVWLTAALPAVLGVDLAFVPAWLQTVWHWSPAGSALSVAEAVMVNGGAQLLHHGLQVGIWIGIALAAMALARRMPRRLDAVALPWRRRLTVLALTCAAVLLAAVALPRGSVLAEPATVPPGAGNRLSACMALPTIESVADLNAIARMPGTADFAGGDVGLDVPLQDGRILWIFADTLRQDAGMVRNSMLLADDRCLRVVVPGQRQAVIPDRPHTAVGYWPMSAVAIPLPGYDVVPVWTQRVHQVGPGAFGFESLGPTVAVFVVRPGEAPQMVAMQDLAPDLADVRRPMWGAASAVDGRWVYLYGTANDGATLGFSVRVARVHVDDLLDPSAMRYWDGFDWSEQPASAAEIIPGAGGTSQTFSILRHEGVWYALSKQDEFLGSYLRLWSAPGPAGPFVQGPVLAVLPSELESGHLVYMALAHPDVLPKEGSMVVSYSRNDIEVQHILDDPTQYRPRFLRVWFP